MQAHKRGGTLLFCLLFIVIAALAQQPTGEITGIISDSSGATVPGAAIDVVNASTGLHWNAVSNENGNYAFPVLPPGTYQLEIKKRGSKPCAVTELTSPWAR